MLEEYLRYFVLANQQNWVVLLDVAQFCYNLHVSSSTGRSMFELVMRRQPMTPHKAVKHIEDRCLTAYRFAKTHQDNVEKAGDCLAQVQA